MNKSEIIEKYVKPEDKMLIAKLFDKIEACKRKNIITHTDFLDMYQKNIAEKILKIDGCKYIFFGGYNDADRVMLIFYPEKLTEEMVVSTINLYVQIIRIELPKNMQTKYAHKDYLSGIMKLGIKREKFGDILVDENGADIVVEKEISDYLYNNIQQLTRFNKSKISIEEIKNLKQINIKTEEIRIVIQTLRLDSITSQLANTSRTKAIEIIAECRVFINYEQQYKEDKIVKVGDIIVIRGKGKFKIDKLEGTTRKNRQILTVKKYI